MKPLRKRRKKLEDRLDNRKAELESLDKDIKTAKDYVEELHEDIAELEEYVDNADHGFYDRL